MRSFVPPERFELPTYRIEAGCAIQLRHEGLRGSTGIRTQKNSLGGSHDIRFIMKPSGRDSPKLEDHRSGAQVIRLGGCVRNKYQVYSHRPSIKLSDREWAKSGGN